MTISHDASELALAFGSYAFSRVILSYLCLFLMKYLMHSRILPFSVGF
jgi:hypothetical protein